MIDLAAILLLELKLTHFNQIVSSFRILKKTQCAEKIRCRRIYVARALCHFNCQDACHRKKRENKMQKSIFHKSKSLINQIEFVFKRHIKTFFCDCGRIWPQWNSFTSNSNLMLIHACQVESTYILHKQTD